MVSQLNSPTVSSQAAQTQTLHDPFLPRLEGFVQVVTATHRGFLTDVMAQALRVAGQGKPVLIAQFLKGGTHQGISKPVRLCQHLTWLRSDLPFCINERHLKAEVAPEAATAVRSLWQHTRVMVNRGQYDLVVLDEISLALSLALIPLQDVLGFLQNRPRHVDVVLTGPQMPASLLDVADQITHLRRFHRS
ncbi:MAG: cob(I)yrinic acid a,c-diamide adenosyltransferase [Cyanobacteria bacterium P01_H01_bin.121]